MPSFKLCFSGEIRKVEYKQAGQKSICEVQLCRKNYTKEGEEPTFTWIKATIWEPKDWQTAGLNVGCYIAGIGEFSMRSFTDKDGNKRQAAEVRVNAMDLDVPKPAAAATPAPAPSPKPRLPAGGGGVDEPPFARPLIAETWG